MSQFRFAPPVAWHDFTLVPGGLERWHHHVDGLMRTAVADLSAMTLTTPDGSQAALQFFNPATQIPEGHQVEVPVFWNALPRRLLARFGRAKAMVLADMLWPAGTPARFDPTSPQFRMFMREATAWVRPQDEYCEWRVERDPLTQRLQRLIFTVETPEYWRCLFGGMSVGEKVHVDAGQARIATSGDPGLVARLYSSLLGRTVEATDLAKGHHYNVNNRWNTTHGIVHLSQSNNFLQAAITLCANSTVSTSGSDGRLITNPAAFCASRAFADANRHSDLAIASTVNALARSGACVSLANPVGLGIADVDTSGWALPSGFPPAACLQVVRGTPGCAQRLVIEVPAHCPDTLDRLTIAGEPLLHGGQIAECMTVKTTLLCVLPSPPLQVGAVAATHRGNVLIANRHVLVGSERTGPRVPGHLPAFATPAQQVGCVRRPAGAPNAEPASPA